MAVSLSDAPCAPPGPLAPLLALFGADEPDIARPVAPLSVRRPRCSSPANHRRCADHRRRPDAPAMAPVCEVAAQLRAERQRGREIERAFAQYVSPHVLERLMADPDGLSLGGETRDVTVLFADIRGFTALAEAMKANPRRLIELVSAIMDPMTEIVLAHGGTIDKYMGDCVMAFWGAPGDDPDHARHAFEAAQAMLAAMAQVNERLRAAFDGDIDLPTIEIGIGLNSGECVVGNLGSRKRFDYSVLGDPVNVASRLQNLCKVYDAPLLVGEATAQRLDATAGLAEVDRLALRGRTQTQGVFGLAQAVARSRMNAARAATGPVGTTTGS